MNQRWNINISFLLGGVLEWRHPWVYKWSLPICVPRKKVDSKWKAVNPKLKTKQSMCINPFKLKISHYPSRVKTHCTPWDDKKMVHWTDYVSLVHTSLADKGVIASLTSTQAIQVIYNTCISLGLQRARMKCLFALCQFCVSYKYWKCNGWLWIFSQE